MEGYWWQEGEGWGGGLLGMLGPLLSHFSYTLFPCATLYSYQHTYSEPWEENLEGSQKGNRIVAEKNKGQAKGEKWDWSSILRRNCSWWRTQVDMEVNIMVEFLSHRSACKTLIRNKYCLLFTYVYQAPSGVRFNFCTIVYSSLHLAFIYNI